MIVYMGKLQIVNMIITEVLQVVLERTDESVFLGFGLVERMKNDRVANWISVGESASSRSVGRPREKWIDTLKDRLKERSFGVR